MKLFSSILSLFLRGVFAEGIDAGSERGLTRIAWTPARLATLQQRQGAGWRWSWEPGEPRSRVTLQRVAPRIEEWPAYAALVAELTALEEELAPMVDPTFTRGAMLEMD